MPRHRRRGSRCSCPRPGQRACCPADTARRSPWRSVPAHTAATSPARCCRALSGRLLWRASRHRHKLPLPPPRRDLRTDLREVQVHALHVDCGQDARRATRALRTEGAKQVDRTRAGIAHHGRARADRCPDVAERTLLADAGLVLEPHLHRGRARPPEPEQRCLQAGTEVFLNASCAAASFFGWYGRGCSRVKRHLRSHLTMVRFATVTAKQRSTSPHRSTQRQRMILWISGSGPSSTHWRTSLICASVSLPAAPGDLRDSKPSTPC